MIKNILLISRNTIMFFVNGERPYNKKTILLRDIRPLLFLYQIYKNIIFYPILGISTMLAALLATIFLNINVKYSKYIAKLWARINAYSTPISVETHGFEKIDKNQSYVIVANHQSQFDIFVIYGWLPIDFRWVMKIQLRKVPALGYYCYKAGHVFIDRSNPKAAKASINAAKEQIQGGTSITFFPEGKRCATDELYEFKKGAFKFALDMNLPILPITLVGTRNVLPANGTTLFPGKTKMIVHDSIPIEGYNEDNLPELIEKSKAVIKKGLKDYKFYI